MGEINNALGGKAVLRGPDGREYLISAPTQACYAEFERWLENKARQRLAARRAQMSKAEYEEELRELRRDINSLVYSWGSRCAMDAMRSAEGNTEFAAILVRQSDKSATATDMLAAAEADPEHYRDVMAQLLGVEDDDPNVKTEPQ